MAYILQLKRLQKEHKAMQLMNSEWKTVTLGDVCEIYRGGSPRPIKNYITSDPSGVNWIKIGDVSPDGKYINRTAEKILPSGIKHSRLVERGDFLLSNSMSFGRPYICQIDGCIHDGWLVLKKISNSFVPDYLYYILRSPNVSVQFDQLAKGSTVRNLNRDSAAKVLVPVPPLSEQERIVGVLDTAFEKIDKIQRNAERNLANAKELFRQVLDEEMTPKEGWLSSELQNAVDKICSLSYGIVQPGDEKSDGVPVVRPVDLGKRTIGSKGLKRISPDISQSYRRTLLKGEEILLCVRGETGIVSMASKVLAGANVTRGIVPILFDKQKINQIFGYYLMLSPFVYLQIKNKTTGTALKQINIGDLRQILVSYPNLQTQDKIVKILDKSSAVLESLDNNFQQIISSSTELKQQLLAKAFNGEL